MPASLAQILLSIRDTRRNQLYRPINKVGRIWRDPRRLGSPCDAESAAPISWPRDAWLLRHITPWRISVPRKGRMGLPVLKEPARLLLGLLAVIFGESRRTGEVPEGLRRANVFLSSNTGKEDPDDHRPLSRTSTTTGEKFRRVDL